MLTEHEERYQKKFVESAEASAPFKAAILPPPGTGSLQATLSKKSFTVKSANMVFSFK